LAFGPLATYNNQISFSRAFLAELEVAEKIPVAESAWGNRSLKHFFFTHLVCLCFQTDETAGVPEEDGLASGLRPPSR